MRPLTRKQKALAAANARQPAELVELERADWPSPAPPGLQRVLRSRTFLVQVFAGGDGARLSVCRTEQRGGRWTDGITWDELQRVKREAGYGDLCAVELFPPDRDVVNVANMRHLWLLQAPPRFMWRRDQ